MPTIHIDFPISVFSVMQKEPEEFAKELRLAAAVKWYELGKISQEKAAEIAGLSRSEFIESLAKYKIDFMQYSEKEIDTELKDAR
ncbi:MAG: UPF0175 family protein [Promethearchaeota archaeon]